MKTIYAGLSGLLLTGCLSGCGLLALPYDKDPVLRYAAVKFDPDASRSGVQERADSAQHHVEIRVPTDAAPLGAALTLVLNLGKQDVTMGTVPMMSDAYYEFYKVNLCQIADPNIGAVYSYKALDAANKVVSSGSFVNTRFRSFCV